MDATQIKRCVMSDLRLTPAELALQQATAAFEAQDFAKAAAAYSQAASMGAAAKLVARGHALALSQLGAHSQAVDAYRPWFAKNQKDTAALNLMGVLLKRAGQLAKAAEVLERARKLRAADLSVLQNLGNVYELLNQAEKAAGCFAAGVKINPKSAELWRLLGRARSNLGQYDPAIDCFRRAFALTPQDTVVCALLVQTLHLAGRLDEARQTIARLRAERTDPEYSVIEARLANRTGDTAHALALLRDVLAHAPQHFSANMLFAAIIGDSDREAANAALERAVAAMPDNFDALERLTDSYVRSRYGVEAAHIERAYDLTKDLMARFPDRLIDAARTVRTVLMRVMDEDRMAQTGDLAVLLKAWQTETRHSYVHYELGQVETLQDRLDLVEWHRQWGRRVSARMAQVAVAAMPALHLGRKLRVGFMSSDLRNHPVTYFALPLLEQFNRDDTEVFCYSFCEKPSDKVQDHLARQVSAFRHWPRQTIAQAAEGIAADGLDILFELGGSTAMNKLEVMAHRPARLTASWLGYPHSAGLEQIDFILTDPYLRPADQRLLIERPFEMPASWVCLSRMFGPHVIAPDTPQARKGWLTFGTANNPYKYTPKCLDAWAAVLRAVDGARFVFLRPEAGVQSFVQNTRTAFARRDVDPARIEFIGVRGDHMRHYNEIDIALDSLPHVGGTTTCEALWMGVPTITLVGPGFAERLSYSNLSNAGLGDLAAFDLEDYVAKAAALAADPARRRALRHALRGQIAAHPLGQTQRFTDDFYALARKVAQE